MWSRLFTGPADWHLLVAAIVPTFLVAWLAGRYARRGVRRAMHALLGQAPAASSPFVRAPLRVVGAAVFLLVFLALIFPAFEIAGLQPRAGVRLRSLNIWAFDSGLRVLLIAAGGFALIRTVTVAVQRFEDDIHFGTGLDAVERSKRARTLGSVLTNITTVVVLAVASLMILHEFNVDIAPALTGAGIVGVALGFGAQSLVKDMIGGFFLILENQIRVGDAVSINGTGGIVEEIRLRTTVLRDENGTVYIFPNGSITTLANQSMQFSYYVVNLPLAYGEDVDAVTTLLTGIAAKLQTEEAYAPFMLGPLEVWGVDAFEQYAVRVKVRIKTAPLKQWFVGREFRRRINMALQERGIRMWSPQLEASVSIPNAPTPSARSTPNDQPSQRPRREDESHFSS
jgi:small-conductance mechanosensitive channel